MISTVQPRPWAMNISTGISVRQGKLISSRCHAGRCKISRACATGPARTMSHGRICGGLVKDTGSTGQVTWTSDAFLLNETVGEWQALSLGTAHNTGWPGFMTINIGRRLSLELVFYTARYGARYPAMGPATATVWPLARGIERRIRKSPISALARSNG